MNHEFDFFFFEGLNNDVLMIISSMQMEGRKKSKSGASESGEENMTKKELALQQALDQITSSFGKGSIMWLGRAISSAPVPVISTGSFALDIALGIGGLPKVTHIKLLLQFHSVFHIYVLPISESFTISHLDTPIVV